MENAANALGFDEAKVDKRDSSSIDSIKNQRSELALLKKRKSESSIVYPIFRHNRRKNIFKNDSHKKNLFNGVLIELPKYLELLNLISKSKTFSLIQGALEILYLCLVVVDHNIYAICDLTCKQPLKMNKVKLFFGIEIALNCVMFVPLINIYPIEIIPTFTLDMLIFIFVIFRVYAFFKIFTEFTDFRNLRADRICYLKQCDADMYFSLKCMMHKYGLTILILIFALVIGFFGIWFRIFEISNYYYNYEREHDYSTMFFDLSNCFWLVIVSMSTIGYGDRVPVTTVAQIFTILIIIFGIWILSLLVANLNLQITLNDEEMQAYRSIQEVKNSKKVDFETAYKYMTLKNRILKDSSGESSLNETLFQFIKIRENIAKDIKIKFQYKPLEDKIKNMIDSQDKLWSIMKLGFIYRLSDTRKKLDIKLMSLMEGCRNLIQLAVDNRNASYSTNNLAKCLLRYSTVGKVKGILYYVNYVNH